MTMKLFLSDIYVKRHKILKVCNSEIENLPRFCFMNCHSYRHYKNLLFLFLTEMFYGAKHWTSLECKLYFFETIVFNDIMEINFTQINTCLV